MATAKGYMMARRATTVKNYRFLTTDSTTIKPSNSFEFDESDLWSTGSTQSNSAEFRSPPPISRKPRRCVGGEAMSVPVNVPDWSKILKDEYNGKWNFNGGDDGGDDENNEEWVPPHEYLARTRNASLSVHEGIGRTLKGRDLSRVRNAIWEKTGFQD